MPPRKPPPKFDSNFFTGQLASILGNEINIRIDQYVKDLEKRVIGANKGFYEKLATIVGQTEMPALGQFKTPWKPLTKAYSATRLRQYDIPRNVFFLRTGNLGKKLRMLDGKVNKLLGRPTVKLVLGTRVLKPGYTAKGMLIFGPNKKFASLKQALEQDLPSKIIINPFPMLNPAVFTSGVRDGAAEIAVTEGETFNDRPAPLKRSRRPDGSSYTPRRKKAAKNRSGPLYAKLGVTSQESYVKRPFTRALLNWWMENKIRALVERNLK